MSNMNMICIWIAEIVPLVATLFSLVYGLLHFFKKGKPLFLQSITLAMACYALGSIYHLCISFTNATIMEGFTPAYLGRIGFFMFLITASYGQLDRIVDDGSPKMRAANIIALIAPIAAGLLYIPNYYANSNVSTKISYALIWIPAVAAVYYNLKHAIIPDLDFGFIKAIRPFNIFAMLLGFAELLCLTAWDYFSSVFLAVMSVIFGILCVCTMVSVKRGVEKWTI